ncbi:MAG TPA: MFS transporter [Rhizomicrobium sp.]|jgi:ACS family tartrate transporter-like MFS transporter|nr:MFS transporter [Rhizomicrobium sp.]
MDAADSRVFAKAAWRLIPVMALLFVVAYLDRVNVSSASLTMNKDLALSAQAYGFGAGIFFFGYFLFEVPSNVILEKIGARIWISRIMLTWGMVSMANAFVTGPLSFYVVRFTLGLAEAGFFPGMVLYLTYWFPSLVRARLIALFLAALPLTNLVGGPLSGLILGMEGYLHLHGWQWLFLIEGLPSVLLGLLVLRWLPNGPADAKFIGADERATIAAALAAEPRHAHTGLLPMLLDPRVWLLSLPDFGIVLALYGVNLWLPQIVRGMGFSILQTSFLAALPYLAAMFVMVLWGISSDARGERIWHIAVASLLGAAGLVGAALFQSHALVLLSLSVSVCGVYAALAVFWTLPPSFLGGTAAAGGIALINSISNLGGFFGPAIMGWLKQHTGTYAAGMGVLAAGLVVAAVLVIAIGRTLTFAGRAQALEKFTRLNA